MGIYSDVRKMAHDFGALKNNKCSNFIVKQILLIIIFVFWVGTIMFWCFDFYIQWNFEHIIEVPSKLNEFLNKYTFDMVVTMLVYTNFVCFYVWKITRFLERRIKHKFMTLVITLEDFFEISILCILSFKLFINFVLENYCEKTIVNNADIYILCMVWFILNFLKWLYGNNMLINENKLRYTNYFDSEGKRIPTDSEVIFYSKLYDVVNLDSNDNVVNERKTKKWYICDKNDIFNKDKILLEDAVRDANGKIKVYKYRMGESEYFD